MPLKVSLRAGERVIVNGAVISADAPTNLIFHNRVSMILERQIMHPDEAVTPSRRIYFAVQNAYIAEPGERDHWLIQSVRYIDELDEATTSKQIHEQLDTVRQKLAAGDFYPAMRICRDLFRHDDLMLAPSQRVVDRRG
jgi:flagellar biosynthesis repressor protein FlbT